MRGVSMVVVGLFLCTVSLFAQVETARITGTISDSTGAVIPGANITFLHVATNTSVEMQSDATGRYVSPPLRIGEYRIEVSSEGFKRAVRTGVVLTESIDVTADAPLGTPNLQVGNRNIGIISGAGRPRNLQFGLKLIW